MATNISTGLGLNRMPGDDSLIGTQEYEDLLAAAAELERNYAQDREARDVARGMDLDTISRLRAVADGTAPSIPEALARKAAQQSADQSLGLAATLGGANPGAALRSGMEARAAAPSESAADIAALKAREMDAARALLAETTGRGRATDVAGAVGTGNTAASLAAAPFNAMVGEKAADAAREAAILQAGGTALSGVGGGSNAPPTKYTTYDPWAPSDVRLKTDVQPAPEMADDFLRGLNRGPAPTAQDPRSVENFLGSLKPQSFEYKNPDGANMQPGQRLGVMAQDLPRQNIVTDPNGRKWISADVISDVLAGLGRVNEKVDSVSAGSGRGGRATPGNIDLNKRPRVKNADGSTSTVRSMGVNIDGREVLIPTISDDGRVMTEDEAVRQFRKTGRHLGKFGSVDESNRAAQSLHEAEARRIQQPPTDEVMIPQSAVHDYLAGLGIVAP